MDTLVTILAGGLILTVIILSIQEEYQFNIECLSNPDSSKVLILYYNKHTLNGIVRKHKIIYDTGRNQTGNCKYRQ